MKATLRRARLAGGLASALALTACGAPYPNFAHTPAFRIEGVRTPITGGASQRVVIYRDGAKLRVETLTPAGRTVVVFDQGTNDAYALAPLPPAGATPTATPSAADTHAAPSATPLPVAPPPNVIGMAIRVADAQAPQPLETPWSAVTKGNVISGGGCRVAGQNGREWRATATALAVDQRTACITQDGIVLREREGSKTIFEATRLDRGPQPAALFGVPAGFQRQTPASVAETAANTTTTIASNTGPAG